MASKNPLMLGPEMQCCAYSRPTMDSCFAYYLRYYGFQGYADYAFQDMMQKFTTKRLNKIIKM